MFTKKVLDRGFVTLRNMSGPTRRAGHVQLPGGAMGFVPPPTFDASDVDVANAARLSFEGQDQGRTYEAEMKLNRYLMENHHDTPFEVIVVWLEMKLPIFVARQLVRQRTQSINEASGRYIKLSDDWYIPEVVGAKPDKAKQGQQNTLDPRLQTMFKADLDRQCAQSYALYEEYLRQGVAPEHARMMLHVNHYTHWMTTQNLRNLLMSFLRLRDHSHAQIEAQVYAQATIELIEPHLPGIVGLYRELIKLP